MVLFPILLLVAALDIFLWMGHNPYMPYIVGALLLAFLGCMRVIWIKDL